MEVSEEMTLKVVNTLYFIMENKPILLSVNTTNGSLGLLNPNMMSLHLFWTNY